MLDPQYIGEKVDQFLREDIGLVDLTSAIMIDDDATGCFNLNAREDIVVSGIDVAKAVFTRYVPGCSFDARVKDGDRVGPGTILAQVRGPARGLLTAERTALNMMQHMSGIATLTALYVKEIEGTKAQLIDTRKTTPGLRGFEKHAVECGGGRNHRLGLDNGIMIKDNHIAVCGGLTAAIQRATARVPVLTKVEVECDRLDQVEEAMNAGADILLLDNMDNDMLRKAVAMVGGKIPLEASGGVNLETIGGISQTGVDFISVGRITQSAPAIDIGLDDAEGS